MDLKNSVIIVTGGGAGIGKIYSKNLSKMGAKVVVADLDENGAESTREEIVKNGGVAIAIKTDVSDEGSTRNMAKKAYEEFGRIDALINNAAIYAKLGSKKLIEDITTSEFDKVFAVNVKGVWLCIQAVLKYMKETGGSIINISSTVALAGTVGFPHYVASKSAVVGLTKSLARELGKYNIRVNAIAPGLVTNEATLVLNDKKYVSTAATVRSLSREQTPDDLIGPVMFLLSDESGFVTGQTIVVDGGQYML